jgi:REP-associated tyrosine transposase
MSALLPAGRRSTRLPDYDYAGRGGYFVTLCTQGRMCLFGKVAEGKMLPNPLGEIVRDEWFKTADIRPHMRLHDAEFVVMPNHIHGIIWILRDPSSTFVRATGRSPRQSPCGPRPGSIAAIVAGFKSATTSRINRMRNTPGAPVWQRNYFEHIIRPGESLERIRRYILENPPRWAFDPENPHADQPDLEDPWARA